MSDGMVFDNDMSFRTNPTPSAELAAELAAAIIEAVRPGRMDRCQLLNSHAGNGILRQTKAYHVDAVVADLAAAGIVTAETHGYRHVKLVAS